MPKKETKTLLIIIFLIDFIFIGGFAFLYFYTNNLSSQSTNTENDIKTELKREDGTIQMKDDLAQGKIYQEKLTGYVIPAGGTVDFIKTLENLVSNSGLKSNIKSVINEPYGNGTAIGLELIRVNMAVIGEWKNTQFFLESLENYPLKIDIKTVSLSKTSNQISGKNVPEWTGTFEFTVVKTKDTK